MENLDGQEMVEKVAVEETENVVEQDATEQPEQTGEQVEEPQNTEEDKQSGVQKRINKIYREKMEAIETARKEQERREELEAKLKELEKPEIPEVPEIPDYLDPDYEVKLKEREQILFEKGRLEAKEEALAQIEQQRIKESEVAKQKEIEGMVKTFRNRGTEYKIEENALRESETLVSHYINSPELAQYLLNDENGPLSVTYLSQNIDELEKVSQMPATTAAVYIATKIAPEAQKLKPKTTKAPEPAYEPVGRSNPPSESPFLDGAKFE